MKGALLESYMIYSSCCVVVEFYKSLPIAMNVTYCVCNLKCVSEKEIYIITRRVLVLGFVG